MPSRFVSFFNSLLRLSLSLSLSFWQRASTLSKRRTESSCSRTDGRKSTFVTDMSNRTVSLSRAARMNDRAMFVQVMLFVDDREPLTSVSPPPSPCSRIRAISQGRVAVCGIWWRRVRQRVRVASLLRSSGSNCSCHSTPVICLQLLRCSEGE